MEEILTQKQFYMTILLKIKEDMEEKNMTTTSLKDKKNKYIVSNGQYYSIQKLANGEDAPVLSNSRMQKLCKYLDIEYEPCFKVKKKTASID